MTLSTPARSLVVAFVAGLLTAALICGVAWLTSASDDPPPAVAANSLQATVSACHDGDTCRLLIAGHLWLNVRLAGIDAPEVKSRRNEAAQPLGTEARDRLRERVDGQVVEVRQVDLDPYNRPVVDLTVAGRSVNLELLSLGLAEAYRGRTRAFDKGPYLQAEAEARAEARGIWGLDDFESPADYRKRHRGIRRTK